MAHADSMFLFEIIVEELKSYINCKEFCIRSQFADIFCINLKDPNERRSFLPKHPKRIKVKRKLKIRTPAGAKMQTGQSILFANNIETLMSYMKQYPMELSLWSKVVPDYKIGSTHIPWGTSFYDYLNKLQAHSHRRQEPSPVCVTGDYNVFDEFTSKRMAVIKLNIKLSYLKDKITTQFRSLSEENPRTFMYTGLTSTHNKDMPTNLSTETGIIKTVYNVEKRKVGKNIHAKNTSTKQEIIKIDTEPSQNECEANSKCAVFENKTEIQRLNFGTVSLVRSDTNIDKKKQTAIIKSKSCSCIIQERFNILNYIFGGNTGPFGNQVYCVRYFTVENDFVDSPKSESAKSAGSPKSESTRSAGSPKSESSKSAGSPKSESAKYAGSPKSESGKSSSGKDASDKSRSSKSDEIKVKERYKFRICESVCPGKKEDSGSYTQSVCSLDLPQEASHLITMKKCHRVDCDHKEMRVLPTPPDDRILIDLSSRRKDCCDITEKVEEVVGGMKAKMKFGDDPCYCECECRFGFMKKTTFCNICGGYEIAGEEYSTKPGYDLPFPCPIFHKLAEKGKMKTLSTSGSESKKRQTEKTTDKTIDKITDKATDKSAESEKEVITKKGKKRKKDDRFKFNYGYTAPQIGHSRCAMPCVGSLGVVPKKMGWLWTAEDIPGMKFRPNWKPGAVNKHVLRLLKIAKNPGEVLAKKRKKESGKGKRPLKRPLLTVQKKDGEYTVTMETMKTYTKPRTFNQYPYEDKPLMTYTIGRTSEENLQRKKKKERALRRLERLQREFIQSAFKDMCQEICIKTYQQALGILPEAEIPDCSCFPAEPCAEKTDLDHSCSCSEDSISESDTDSDEWVVEFTPPNAHFDPTFKSKKIVTADNSTQYTYMDYRVKLLDRYGNPVPRYFKGPDGKQQCSDLGGFWGPNNKWLEINTDGYIGPDEKWAPNIFLGPNGEQVDAEAGKFQALNGTWLVVGVDGYVDAQGKWKFYPKPKPPETKKKRLPGGTGKKGDKKEETVVKQSETTWSCFGDVSPKHLSKMGIVGHGHDKKLLLSALQDMLAQGEDVKIPEPSTVPRSNKGKRKHSASQAHNYAEKRKCKHATPSDKGIVAVDGHGNKTYFRYKDFNNRRPKERIAALTSHGISLSSFHVPCFHSFVSSELMKKQQYDRLVALAKGANPNETQKQKGAITKTKSAQADYVYVV